MRLLQKDDIVIIFSLLRVEQQLPFVVPSHLEFKTFSKQLENVLQCYSEINVIVFPLHRYYNET